MRKNEEKKWWGGNRKQVLQWVFFPKAKWMRIGVAKRQLRHVSNLVQNSQTTLHFWDLVHRRCTRQIFKPTIYPYTMQRGPTVFSWGGASIWLRSCFARPAFCASSAFHVVKFFYCQCEITRPIGCGICFVIFLGKKRSETLCLHLFFSTWRTVRTTRWTQYDRGRNRGRWGP